MSRKAGSPGMQCPHCKSFSSCTFTSVMTAVTRRKLYRCANLECGHVFETYEQVSRTLVMSSLPKAGLSIPFSEQLKAAVSLAAKSV